MMKKRTRTECWQVGCEVVASCRSLPPSGGDTRNTSALLSSSSSSYMSSSSYFSSSSYLSSSPSLMSSSTLSWISPSPSSSLMSNCFHPYQYQLRCLHCCHCLCHLHCYHHQLRPHHHRRLRQLRNFSIFRRRHYHYCFRHPKKHGIVQKKGKLNH